MPRTKKSAAQFVLHLDTLPGQGRMLPHIERAARTIADFYAFEDMVPATIEDPRAYAELIKAGLLDERPPVIAKTRAGEDVMLRVSGVLGAIRAYASHRMQDLPHPLKFSVWSEAFFLGPEYADAPHAGTGESAIRREQEWCLVMIGEESSVAEAEIIQILWKVLQEIHINSRQNIEVRINAVGCASCRGSYRSAVGNYFRLRKTRLCPRSRRDLKKSPARIFSCADEKCRILANLAPQTLDFLCEACKHHIRNLFEFLDEAQIPYFLDSRFFREGSWLNTVLFEFVVRSMTQEHPGADVPPVPKGDGDVSEETPPRESESGLASVSREHPLRLFAEGGRVSLAAALITGKETHAVAGTIFLGPMEQLLEAPRLHESAAARDGIFLVQLGDLAKRKSFKLLETLRSAGIVVKESLGRDSIKVQLKIAERSESRYALIIGQKEALDNTVIVREVESGIQETIPQEKLIDFLKKKLKK